MLDSQKDSLAGELSLAARSSKDCSVHSWDGFSKDLCTQHGFLAFLSMGANLQSRWQVLTAYREVWLKCLLEFFAAESADEPSNPYTMSLDEIMIVSVFFHLVTLASEN